MSALTITRENLAVASVLLEDGRLESVTRKLVADGFGTAASVAELGGKEIGRRYGTSPGAIARIRAALGAFDYTLKA